MMKIFLLVQALLLLATVGGTAWAETPNLPAAVEIFNLPDQFRLYIDGVEVTQRCRPHVKDSSIGYVIKSALVGNPVTSVVRIENVSTGQVFETKIIALAGEKNRIEAFAAPRVDLRGHLRLIVTLDTKVFINGKLTLQEGEIRDFQTPELNEGKTYPVKVKFDFRNKTGRRILRTKGFVLRAGQTLIMDDIEALAEQLPAEIK